MRVLGYTVEGLGNTPIYEQAVNAAKIRAVKMQKPVAAVQHRDNGDTTVLYYPNGQHKIAKDTER